MDTPGSQFPVKPDGWYRGELHCHTVYSDGDSWPADVIAAAKALGLDFLAITDHNVLCHLTDQAMHCSDRLILIPGFEVTTYKDHWNIWGAEAGSISGSRHRNSLSGASNRLSARAI